MSKIKQEEMVKIFNAIYGKQCKTIEEVCDYIEALQFGTKRNIEEEKSIMADCLKVIGDKSKLPKFNKLIKTINKMEKYKNSFYINEKILHNCFIKFMKNPDCFEKLIY